MMDLGTWSQYERQRNNDLGYSIKRLRGRQTWKEHERKKSKDLEDQPKEKGVTWVQ